MLRKVVKAAGLVPAERTLRERRHSVASPLSASSVALEAGSGAGRPQRHSGHRGGLLQANPTGDRAGRYGNEPNLSYGKVNP